MKTAKENALQSESSAKPIALNLQTKPFAATEIGESTTDSYRERSVNHNNQSNNLLLRLIDSGSPRQSSINLGNDVVQRHSRQHFDKVRANRKSGSPQIQAKLKIGEPHDQYEKEADATAAQVVQQINLSPQKRSLQRKSKLNSGEASADLGLHSQPASKVVQRSNLRNVVQREDTDTPIPSTLGGYGSDTIEGGGNFLEFLDDAANAIKTVRDSNSSTLEKGISGSKALGSLTGTVVAGLKANEIEKMTSCLEAMSEGMKIFDAGKEVWEAVRKVDFWNDTTMQTFENVSVVVGKLGDFILGSAKIANAFVSAMEWTTGRLSAFAKWVPISELIIKCSKFMVSVKKWIFAFTSYKRLKELQGNISDPSKQKQIGYLVDEQWSRLKNGAIPCASTGVDFASETAKYFPSLGINVAIVAGLGTVSKAVPLGHKVLTSGYDLARQGWRNLVKTYASSGVAEYLAAIDKADLDSFRDGLTDFVLNERRQPHGMLILESLGLGARVQKMSNVKARKAIEEAVQDIK